MKINNIFYSIQGEGLDAGLPTIFVRLQGCPFRCPYCDEPAALAEGAGQEMSADEIVSKIDEIGGGDYKGAVEITGGSPEWQLQELEKFVFKYSTIYNHLTIQLSGGIEVPAHIYNKFDRCKVDYKPDLTDGFKIDYHLLRPQDEVKFLIDGADDLKDFIKHMKNFESLGISAQVIVTQKEPRTLVLEEQIENMRILTENVLKYCKYNMHNIHIMPRLHTLYWQNRKGV